MNPTDCLVDMLGETPVGWIFMKLGSGIHGAQRMNPKDICDSQTRPVAPPAVFTSGRM